MAKDAIEHQGRITSIDGNKIKVHIETTSACSKCHAKRVCSAANMENKEIEVLENSSRFHKGEDVRVLLKQSLGFQALFFGYVFPFIILLIALFILSEFFNNEAVIGILSLGTLIPYYFVIYYCKNYFQKSFRFDIQKLN